MGIFSKKKGKKVVIVLTPFLENNEKASQLAEAFRNAPKVVKQMFSGLDPKLAAAFNENNYDVIDLKPPKVQPLRSKDPDQLKTYSKDILYKHLGPVYGVYNLEFWGAKPMENMNVYVMFFIHNQS